MTAARKFETVRASGTKRKFRVRMTVDVEVEVDQAAIDVVDDEWRSHLFDLHSPSDIVEHVAFNHLLNGVDDINQLDGWAHVEHGLATFEVDRDVEFETEETTQCAFTVVRGGRKLRCVRTIHDGDQHTIVTKKGGHKFVSG